MMWLMLLVLASVCEGRSLRVPAEFTTIQSAMDSVIDGDTVLVSLGTYAEALHTPARSFVLMGDVPSDTADIPRPVIDPSPLPGSDSLACLHISGETQLSIQNMRFRNGSQMYPRRQPYTQAGGILCDAPHVFLRYCMFDSTYMGLVSTSHVNVTSVTMYDCRYIDEQWGCIRVGGRAVAARCYFSGLAYEALVFAGDSSEISECLFVNNSLTSLLDLYGVRLVANNNMFTSSTQHAYAAILIGRNARGLCSGHITNNMFTGLQMGPDVLELNSACTDSVIVRNNVFSNNRRGWGQSAGQLVVQCYHGESGTAPGLIENNTFYSTLDGSPQHGDALVLWSAGTARRNTFVGVTTTGIPAVWALDGRSVLTDNDFVNVPAALCKYQAGGDSLDARRNWWGDSSGPRDPVLNPDGNGSAIGCNHEVMISPWLHSPYADIPGDPPFRPLPSSLSLSSFPNPFNPVTRITYGLSKPGRISLTVYNLLGREAAVLVNHSSDAGEFSLEWDAGNFPSGMYFAVLCSGGEHVIRKMLLMK